jgi:hypothetical protein
VVVFHRGELNEAQKAIVTDLGQDGKAGEIFGNVRTLSVDLDGEVKEGLKEVWEKNKSETLPWVVVHYPWMTRIPVPMWTGPLGGELVTSLLDSPARRETARRLAKGDSAVWVLLEIGDKKKDDEAFKKVTEELKKLEENLAPPEVSEEDIAQGYMTLDPDQLEIKFSALRLSRKAPAEKMFVEMLLGTEPDLKELKEPMVFPIFGRGRALYALVGEGINEDNIAEAGFFLTGPCSCTVKGQNPGTDMLLSVDWDTLVFPFEDVDVDEVLPPLAGLGAFGAAVETKIEEPKSEDAMADASETADPAKPDTEDNTTTDEPADESTTETQAEPTESAEEAPSVTPAAATDESSSTSTPAQAESVAESPILRNILIVAIAGIGVVILGSVLLARKSG